MPTATHNRMILRLTGADRAPFLQGLITNDVEALQNGAVYAAMLTPQGKLLADFFVVPAPDAILLDVAAAWGPGLLQRLNMYRLRADVQIEPMDMPLARGLGPAPDGAFADPRHPALGWRHYGGTADQTVEWDTLRVTHLIPESGLELTPDTFILEAGFERLNGVDFRKGCYVGQEVTARMKHKTELRKGLTRVAVSGTAPVGTEITRDNRPAGTLFTQAEGCALAYLRFDRATPPLQAGDARITDILGVPA